MVFAAGNRQVNSCNTFCVPWVAQQPHGIKLPIAVRVKRIIRDGANFALHWRHNVGLMNKSWGLLSAVLSEGIQGMFTGLECGLSGHQEELPLWGCWGLSRPGEGGVFWSKAGLQYFIKWFSKYLLVMASFSSVRSPAELVTGMLLNPADEMMKFTTNTKIFSSVWRGTRILPLIFLLFFFPKRTFSRS